MDLKKLFDDQLNKPKPKDPNYVKDPTPTFKPSMLGSPCHRKIYYSYNKVPQDQDFDPKMKRIMLLGDMFHDALKDTFREAGIMIDYYGEDHLENPDKYKTNSDREFRLTSPDLGIKLGKIDAILKIDGKIYLGEFKSINLKGFEKLHSPKDDHLIQATLYLYIFNKMLAEGKYKHIKELDGYTQVEGIIYLYVCKDNTEMKQFAIGPYQKVFVDTVNKIESVKAHTVNKTLPPKTDDWCQSCPWAFKCKKNYIPS